MATANASSSSASGYNNDPASISSTNTALPPAPSPWEDTTTNDTSAWLSAVPLLNDTEGSVEPQWTHNAPDDAVWEDSFSFLNDGLFSKL